jgi:hypothetical protein
VNREEIYRRGDVDLCQSSDGWGELIYRAGSVAAVEKSRCVKGKLDVGNTAVTLSSWPSVSVTGSLALAVPIKANSAAL